MRTHLVVALLASLAAPGVARAVTATCDPEDPTDCVYTVTKGEPAPASGILTPTARAAREQAQVELTEEKHRLQLQQASEEAAVKVAGEKRLREIDAEGAKLREDLLRRALEDVAPSGLSAALRHPALWFAAGVATTVIVTAGTVAVYDALNRGRMIPGT